MHGVLTKVFQNVLTSLEEIADTIELQLPIGTRKVKKQPLVVATLILTVSVAIIISVPKRVNDKGFLEIGYKIVADSASNVIVVAIQNSTIIILEAYDTYQLAEVSVFIFAQMLHSENQIRPIDGSKKQPVVG